MKNKGAPAQQRSKRKRTAQRSTAVTKRSKEPPAGLPSRGSASRQQYKARGK